MVFLQSDLVREIQMGGGLLAWGTHSLNFSHLLFSRGIFSSFHY